MKLYSILIVFMLALAAQAQSSDDYLKELIRSFDAKQPLGLSFQQDMTEAGQVQRKFMAYLEKQLGAPVGYKAALTNAGAQKKFGVSEPVYGTMLKGMLHPSGASLPAKFGNMPLLEGDLIVRVGDEAINEAKDPMGLLAGLDAVIPFVELPDLLFQKGTTLSGPGLVAANAGARMGVLGETLPLKADEATRTALGQLRVEIFDDKGAMVAHGYSDLLLSHPLNVVKWLRNTLLSQGLRLKKGDLISLGSMSAWVPIVEPGTYTANFYGLPSVEKSVVTVSFTP